MTRTSYRAGSRRTAGMIAGAAVALAALVLTAPSAASATAPAAEASRTTAAADTGWLRLGHFSPDTKAVDVRLTALSGGSVVLELSDVGYGDISPYQALTAGSYVVSMIPTGSGDWSNVAISDTVTVRAAAANTIAAYGPTASLQLRAFDDDLTAPSEGNGRIRVIQASTVTPTVDVATSTGMTIASDARQGDVTPYTEVPAGAWELMLTGARAEGVANVDVASGSVTTLFVLDTADGGLTILPVLDSAAAGVVPIGGVDTGGGWLAADQSASSRVAGAWARAV